MSQAFHDSINEDLLRELVIAILKEHFGEFLQAELEKMQAGKESILGDRVLLERLIKVEEELKALREIEMARFEAMERRFEALLKEMNTRFEALQREMNAKFEAIEREMNARFEAMERRFEALLKEMNTRFEALQREMNARFEAMERRFEALQREMNARFEAVDKRFEAVDKRFEAIEKRFSFLQWLIITGFTLTNIIITILMVALKK